MIFHFGLVAKWKISPIGLQAPDVGDEIVAEAKIILPADQGAANNLIDDLRFGYRLEILGSKLEGKWGHAESVDGKYHRCLCKIFNGETWADAIEMAHDCAITNLDNLAKMLQFRWERMRSHGWVEAQTAIHLGGQK